MKFIEEFCCITLCFCTLQVAEKKKYEEMFYSMGPVAGKLPGDKVKPVLLFSFLSSFYF